MRLTAALLLLALAAPAGASATSAAAPAPIAQTAAPLFADPLDPTGIAVTLGGQLAAVQRLMDQMWQWLAAVRATAAGAATQVIVPLPTGAAIPAEPLDAIAALVALPAQWRALLAAAQSKLGLSDAGGSTAAQHATDITQSPELSHAAATIAAADQQAAAGALQQEVAVEATAAVAEAAARDTALSAAAAAAQAAGDRLTLGAQNLPSSRAGIELLVAGTGAALRQQADLTAALGARVSGVIQQTAQLSGQLGALAGTLGLFSARDAERERRVLDAQLGVADAADGSGVLLQRLLSGAGEPAGEIQLDPLY
jgi:hypothetical protein